jgi:hypothetical protein
VVDSVIVELVSDGIDAKPKTLERAAVFLTFPTQDQGEIYHPG